MIQQLVLGLILVGIAHGQSPIMSCADARTVLGSMSTCNTTWTRVRAALLDSSTISNADATTLCADSCAHTVLQMVYRCASEVGEMETTLSNQTLQTACSRDANGDTCGLNVYEFFTMNLVQHCRAFINQNSCTSTCNSSLSTAIRNMGCCVNIYYNLASVQAAATIGTTNRRSAAEWYSTCRNDGTSTCPNVYVPPPLAELIDVNVCNAAISSLSQDTMCTQVAQQIASNIPNGQSITAAAAEYGCNDTCRNLIMNQINACVRGDLAIVQNTARRLACTYNGANSCGTSVPLSLFPQFRAFCADFVSGANQCPSSCSTTVTMQRDNLGCCFTPLFDVVWLHALTFGGGSITTIRSASELYSACSVTDPGQCGVVMPTTSTTGSAVMSTAMPMPTRTPCENAQLALAANPTCASAQASSAVDFESGRPLAESDVVTVCGGTCRNLIRNTAVCIDEAAARRGSEAQFDVVCRTNGNASCINVNVNVPTVAAALMVHNATEN
ncbi:uncharacterized protein [Dysidea avara]|uniref:uncharacterized protein isoform X2 n=1 Tax=Dysidea avara TaxID=196820 RepID=UPI003327F019